MGTKLEELRNGCFAAAMDDEPMFVLLARDPDAPRVIRNWAMQREDEIERGQRPNSDRAKVMEARKTADKMDDWRKANDGAWRTGLFAASPARAVNHHTERQGDEYACACGARWDASEGDEHP